MIKQKDYSKQFSIFVFSIFLIGKICSSSERILNKYSSIKTKNNSIFLNISEFKYDESIYLTINSENKCDDFLEYLFLDDINDIEERLEFKYTIKPEYKLKKDIFGANKYSSWYYNIVKRSDIIFNLKENVKGNLLYLEFNCIGEVEIINTKGGHENISLGLLLYFSLFMLFAFIYIILKSIISSCIIVMKKSYIITKNWEVKNNNGNYNNPPYINRTLTNINYPKERIVCVEVAQNMYNMKQENNNNNNDKHNYNNDTLTNCNNNGDYVQNYNSYNRQMYNQEYPNETNLDSPQELNLECPRAPNIINSINQNYILQSL
jgi:hypothetical protein